MHDSLHLAELLCARLCHDVSGPLGSLMGATELAAEGEATGEALAVAAEAAGALGSRLRLVRAAWCGDTGALDVPRLAELAAGLGAGRRVAVDLSGLDRGRSFSPALARLALNVLLLAAEALGGSGRVALADAGGEATVATIEGPRAAWPAGLAAAIAEEDAAWAALTSARTIQAPLTALIARRSGLRLALLMPSGKTQGPAPLLFGPAAG